MKGKILNTKAMHALALRVAGSIKKRSIKKRATVIALQGELGAGKTFFAKAFGSALGIKHNMPSPTFLIVRNYPIRSAHKFHRLFHLDLYRIEKVKELQAIGLKEILENPEHVVLIEWADRFPKLIPKNAVWVKIEHGKEKSERHVTVNG